MLYGRDVERARIGALLEGARASRSGALVLRGEPGIGKSALLDDTRERAADMHVLTACGVESELELPFGAMHQLVRPALEHAERLPAAQTEALYGAFGLASGAPPEPFLLFGACLSLISELAEHRPVLCLVDDAHWLDTASADALRFVARRLEAEGIVMLFAAREGDVRSFEAHDLPSLVIGGLETAAAAAVLTRGAGVDAAPSVRDQLVEQTRGNALALLEIPSVLTARQLAGDDALPDWLPLTRHVESVFLERVKRLPDETQRVLLVAAADDSAEIRFVTRAAEALGVPAEALDAAEQAGLIVVRGAQFEFRHPLVRSAVYEAAPSSERRAVHAKFAAELADDGEHADRRAWHLAASALAPDEAVRALDAAAERAQQRAAFMTASKAFERAAELSDDEVARGLRFASAARCASEAGSDSHAVALADRAAPLIDDAVVLAELSHVLGLAEIRRGRPVEAAPILTGAARAIASTHPERALLLLLDAVWAASEGGSVEAQEEAATLAATVEPPSDHGAARFISNLIGGRRAMSEGDRAGGSALLKEALAWGSTADDPRYVLWAGWIALWLGDTEQADALFRHGAALARAGGAIGLLATALRLAGMQHFFAQRFDRAAHACGEAVELARDIGAENHLPAPLAILAEVAAIRGDEEVARARAEEALERANRQGIALAAAWAERALAAIDLGGGHWHNALERLESLAAQRLAGFAHPLVIQTMPDRVEAAIRAGEPERAQTALTTFETWATHSGTPSAQARLACCRALLAESENATTYYEEAVEVAAEGAPFDLARIQLLYGEHLRRRRQRTEARVHLRAALEGFERLRAKPWAERARAELRASGETARKRDPSTVAQLTRQELQVTRLVADGLSNKEIAAQMFLSPRTIDAHLRSVFSKLEISSRTQLVRLRLDEEHAVAEVPAAAAPS